MNIKSPRKSSSLSHKIIRNTAFNIIGRFWYAIIGIAMAPYILHRIGPERYGVLSLTWVLTGYAGLLDMGIGTSLSRFTALFDSSGDKKGLGAMIGTSLFFYAALSAVVITGAFFFIKPVINILNIPPYLYDETNKAFWIAVLCLVVNNISGIFASVLTGMQRMDITNKGTIAISFITIAGTVIAIRSGYGLLGLVMANTLSALIGGLFFIAVTWLLMPDVINSHIRVTREIFIKLYNFGYKMQIVRIAGIVSTQVDKFFIGALLTVELVTAYQLGISVVMTAMSLTALLVSALMPAFMEIEVRDGRTALIGAYLKSVRYLSIITMPLFVFIFLSANDVMALWMGQAMRQSALVIRIVSMAWMINVIAQLSASVCMALDKPNIMARGCSLVLLLNIALSFLFIKIFGFFGAAWGNATAVTIGVLYYVLELNKALGITIKKFAIDTMPYFTVSIITGTMTFILDYFIHWSAIAPDRWGALIALCANGIIFSSLYIIISIRFRLIKDSDISFLRMRVLASMNK